MLKATTDLKNKSSKSIFTYAMHATYTNTHRRINGIGHMRAKAPIYKHLFSFTKSSNKERTKNNNSYIPHTHRTH